MAPALPPAGSDALIDRMINVRLEALKLVKDWSAGAILLQTVGLGTTGALLERLPSGPLFLLVLLLVTVLITSIYVGAVAIAGTVPFIAQSLAENPTCDIYEQRGGIPRGLIARMPLGRLCIWQARLFTLSVVLFAIFVLLR